MVVTDRANGDPPAAGTGTVQPVCRSAASRVRSIPAAASLTGSEFAAAAGEADFALIGLSRQDISAGVGSPHHPAGGPTRFKFALWIGSF